MATESVTDSMVKAIQNYYMLYLILGLSITILGDHSLAIPFQEKSSQRITKIS